MQNNRQFQEACRIWFFPEEERVASTLRQLPPVEREQVWADLSGGVENTKAAASLFQKEDPVMVSQRLAELDQELSRISDKPDFVLVQASSPEYTDCQGFRLMFLRSTVFGAQAAAAKIVCHFCEKPQLFGTDTLGRDIILSDMDQDALETISSGGVHFLPRPDKGGRLICFARQTDLKYKKREDVVSLLQNDF